MKPLGFITHFLRRRGFIALLVILLILPVGSLGGSPILDRNPGPGRAKIIKQLRKGLLQKKRSLSGRSFARKLKPTASPQEEAARKVNKALERYIAFKKCLEETHNPLRCRRDSRLEPRVKEVEGKIIPPKSESRVIFVNKDWDDMGDMTDDEWREIWGGPPPSFGDKDLSDRMQGDWKKDLEEMLIGLTMECGLDNGFDFDGYIKGKLGDKGYGDLTGTLYGEGWDAARDQLVSSFGDATGLPGEGGYGDFWNRSFDDLGIGWEGALDQATQSEFCGFSKKACKPKIGPRGNIEARVCSSDEPCGPTPEVSSGGGAAEEGPEPADDFDEKIRDPTDFEKGQLGKQERDAIDQMNENKEDIRDQFFHDNPGATGKDFDDFWQHATNPDVKVTDGQIGDLVSGGADKAIGLTVNYSDGTSTIVFESSIIYGTGQWVRENWEHEMLHAGASSSGKGLKHPSIYRLAREHTRKGGGAMDCAPEIDGCVAGRSPYHNAHMGILVAIACKIDPVHCSRAFPSAALGMKVDLCLKNPMLPHCFAGIADAARSGGDGWRPDPRITDPIGPDGEGGGNCRDAIMAASCGPGSPGVLMACRGELINDITRLLGVFVTDPGPLIGSYAEFVSTGKDVFIGTLTPEREWSDLKNLSWEELASLVAEEAAEQQAEEAASQGGSQDPREERGGRDWQDVLRQLRQSQGY